MNIEKQKKSFEAYKRKKEKDILRKRPIKCLMLKRILRPVMRMCLKIQRKKCGFQIEFLNGQRICFKEDRPVVFAVTHIGKWDFEIINEILKPHFHVLAADYMNMHGTLEGLFLKAFGVIYVDERDKKDKHVSKLMLEACLRQGDNIMIFPEATWNFSENEIVYDIAYGVADIAKNTGARVIPIALEQYGKRFVINMGDAFLPTDIIQSTEYLRDILATLKFEIWEAEGVFKRESIPYDYWNSFIMKRVSEWRGYDIHEQIVNCFIPKEKQEYFDILRTIRKMKIHKRNSFMVMEQSRFVQRYCR